MSGAVDVSIWCVNMTFHYRVGSAHNRLLKWIFFEPAGLFLKIVKSIGVKSIV